MSKPVNLNKVRKSRARIEKRARADENALKFGRTKADKERDKAQNARVTRLHDAHKRDET